MFCNVWIMNNIHIGEKKKISSNAMRISQYIMFAKSAAIDFESRKN